MKTIDDVIKLYPNGWPENDNWKHAFYWSDGEINLCTGNSDVAKGLTVGTTIICSKEEYEARLGEIKGYNVAWYDYDERKATDLPHIGVECEWCSYNDGVYAKAIILADIGNGDFVIYSEGKKEIVGNPAGFRPLDWDKNKPKVASLDWLIDSVIDCEFSDRGEIWYVDVLNDIHIESPYPYISNSSGEYRMCRPRINHPMVLNADQVDRIPSCFDIKLDEHWNYNVVTFKGLKKGYVYEWEQ